MAEPIRIERLRFLSERAPQISKSALKSLVMELHGLGCLNDEEADALFAIHNLRSW